jgi:hypothetical protein
MTVDQLQSHVGELTAEELKVFGAWFENFIADQWDRQIEEDATNGNLDRMLKNLGIDLDNDPAEPLEAGLARIFHRA